jgi:hypothetical protein
VRIVSIRPNDDIAAFATHLTADDTPPEARRRAVDAITDCVGCSVAGSGTALAKYVLNVISTTNASERTATLIGTNRRASAYDARLYTTGRFRTRSITTTSAIPLTPILRPFSFRRFSLRRSTRARAARR